MARGRQGGICAIHVRSALRNRRAQVVRAGSTVGARVSHGAGQREPAALRDAGGRTSQPVARVARMSHGGAPDTSGGEVAGAMSIQPSQSSGGSSTPLRGSILVAEDDKLSQIVIQKILTKRGFAVCIVENGQQAVDEWLAASDLYDVVVLDINMPILGGAR